MRPCKPAPPRGSRRHGARLPSGPINASLNAGFLGRLGGLTATAHLEGGAGRAGAGGRGAGGGEACRRRGGDRGAAQGRRRPGRAGMAMADPGSARPGPVAAGSRVTNGRVTHPSHLVGPVLEVCPDRGEVDGPLPIPRSAWEQVLPPPALPVRTAQPSRKLGFTSSPRAIVPTGPDVSRLGRRRDPSKCAQLLCARTRSPSTRQVSGEGREDGGFAAGNRQPTYRAAGVGSWQTGPGRRRSRSASALRPRQSCGGIKELTDCTRKMLRYERRESAFGCRCA